MHIADVHYRCALRFKSLVDGVRSPPLRSIMIIPKTKKKQKKQKNPFLLCVIILIDGVAVACVQL
jgi:hypothetical protein